MYRGIRNKWLRGSAFLEYSLIIGTVALALVGMDYYIRRGMQARTKDIADYLISPGGAQRQADNTSVNRDIRSDSATEVDTTADTHMYTGGGTGIEVDSLQTTIANSEVRDLDATAFPFDLLTFVPWQGSAIQSPDRSQYFDGDHVGDDSGYDWEHDDDPCRLESEIQRLEAKANMLEGNAQSIENTNSNLNAENNSLANNPVIQLFQAILSGLGILQQNEIELSNTAQDLRNQAQELRDRAAMIQSRLSTLPPCQG